MRTLPRGEIDDVLNSRSPVSYTVAEREFSSFIQKRLYQLLKGDANEMLLLRRYLAVEPCVASLMPARIDGSQFRADVAEGVIRGVLQFLDLSTPGGPIAQSSRGEKITEFQMFATQYPHIVVEREEVFDSSTRECLYVELRAVRVQNQRRGTLINRALDVGNLAIELTRLTGLP